MRKLVEINSVCNGSTGKIMCDIAKYANKNGFESYCFFGRGKRNNSVNCYKFGNKVSFLFHVFLARLGFNGYGSYFTTKKMVKKLRQINPDIIHLHNIHGYYINLKHLFNYLKKEYRGKIIWTLHDCWAFTGHCAYFTMAKCNKWKKECVNCPQLNCYPKEIFDTTKREYNLKKELFVGINNLTIVTPSKWLKSLVDKSFLHKYNVEVINNGIDLSIFKPTDDDTIYDKYSIPRNKKIILGVANIWEERKGLNIFLELSKMIDDTMIIVLIGLNEKQINNLPPNIIGITRTENQKELACFYTMSSVFVNPSLEETFSLVTVEAMACNTRVIVCNTSAPQELVASNDEVITKHNAQAYYEKILKILEKNKNDISFKKYDSNNMIKKYLSLY